MRLSADVEAAQVAQAIGAMPGMRARIDKVIVWTVGATGGGSCSVALP